MQRFIFLYYNRPHALHGISLHYILYTRNAYIIQNIGTKGPFITTIEFSGIIAAGSLVAGFLGSLTGLGGGIVIVHLLTLGFGVDIHYAMGASLVPVLTTSSGAAATFSNLHFVNIRMGMFLEIAAIVGALAGTFVTAMISPVWVSKRSFSGNKTKNRTMQGVGKRNWI